ncbi:hypothetical protein C8R44DRAFT_895130 [Mycena epipterygia]|nr:hypothetical protein C8R44DRAFT_895130 [Mycena epipterygia]
MQNTDALLVEGNQAYLDRSLAAATRLMLEVTASRSLRIMGAHLKRDANEWDSLARQSRELGYKKQALYCWDKRIISIRAMWLLCGITPFSRDI